MDTAPRMTRSRAREMNATTPAAAANKVASKSASKTTGRARGRGKNASSETEQEVQPTHLFKDVDTVLPSDQASDGARSSEEPEHPTLASSSQSVDEPVPAESYSDTATDADVEKVVDEHADIQQQYGSIQAENSMPGADILGVPTPDTPKDAVVDNVVDEQQDSQQQDVCTVQAENSLPDVDVLGVPAPATPEPEVPQTDHDVTQDEMEEVDEATLSAENPLLSQDDDATAQIATLAVNAEDQTPTTPKRNDTLPELADSYGAEAMDEAVPEVEMAVDEDVGITQESCDPQYDTSLTVPTEPSAEPVLKDAPSADHDVDVTQARTGDTPATLPPVESSPAKQDADMQMVDAMPEASSSKRISKTPQPSSRSSSKIAAAKQTLTAVKPARSTSRTQAVPASAVRNPGRAHAGEPRTVKFQTPGKASSSADAGNATNAATNSRKSVLKPSTVFSTPGNVSRTAKRVSISTPVHPKSANSSRAIVRTPYPKSADKEDPWEEEEDEQQTEARTPAPATADEDMAMEELSTAQSPNAGTGIATSSFNAALDDAAPTPMAAADSKDASMDVDADASGDQVPVSPNHASSPAPVLDDKMGSASPEVPSTRSPTVSPAPGQLRSSRSYSASSSGKYAKAHAALQSLASAEGGSSSRPGSAMSRSLPSYMAPTSAALSKSRIGGPQQLKSKVVAPPDHDTTSLNQLRKQIKDTATRRSAPTPSAKTPSSYAQVHSSMSAIRKTRLVDKASPQKADEQDDHENDNDQSESRHNPAAEAVLTAAMDKLNIGPSTKSKATVAPLKGVPAPEGKHVRFNSKGKPKESPSNTRPKLRGVEPATGSHIRFRDE